MPSPKNKTGKTVKKSSSGTPPTIVGTLGRVATRTHVTPSTARGTPNLPSNRVTTFDQAQQRIGALCAKNNVPLHAIQWFVGTTQASGMNGTSIDQYIGRLWLLDGLILVAESGVVPNYGMAFNQMLDIATSNLPQILKGIARVAA
jgi:hypothetical protein